MMGSATDDSTAHRAEVEGRLAGPPSHAMTPAGGFEYGDAGEGPALLSLHPAFGGWDAGLGMAAPFWSRGFRVIAPSRPGYLGTHAATGPTPEAQADALAALLDELGVARCAVLGHSAGGVVAYLLAARHPDKVGCLVMVSAPTGPDVGVGRTVLRIALTRPVVSRLMARDRKLLQGTGEAAARRLIGDDSTLPKDAVAALAARVVADPSRRAFVTHVWATRTRRSMDRLAGARIDALGVADVLRGPPLSAIECPTLVLHGGAELLDPKHAQRAKEAITGAELRVIPDGCHHGLWVNDDAAEQQAYVNDWMAARVHA